MRTSVAVKHPEYQCLKMQAAAVSRHATIMQDLNWNQGHLFHLAKPKLQPGLKTRIPTDLWATGSANPWPSVTLGRASPRSWKPLL